MKRGRNNAHNEGQGELMVGASHGDRDVKKTVVFRTRPGAVTMGRCIAFYGQRLSMDLKQG